MGRPTGFEPASAGATIRCVNRFTTTAIKYEYHNTLSKMKSKPFMALSFILVFIRHLNNYLVRKNLVLHWFMISIS